MKKKGKLKYICLTICYFGRCPRRVFVCLPQLSVPGVCAVHGLLADVPADQFGTYAQNNMLPAAIGLVVLEIGIEFLLKPLSLISEQPKYDQPSDRVW